MNKQMILVASSLGLLIAGCQQTPVLDKHFGESVTLLKAQQIIHPEAGRNPDPVAGIDGKAAKSGYEQYQATFSKPEPQAQSLTIGVGTGH